MEQGPGGAGPRLLRGAPWERGAGAPARGFCFRRFLSKLLLFFLVSVCQGSGLPAPRSRSLSSPASPPPSFVRSFPGPLARPRFLFLAFPLFPCEVRALPVALGPFFSSRSPAVGVSAGGPFSPDPLDQLPPRSKGKLTRARPTKGKQVCPGVSGSKCVSQPYLCFLLPPAHSTPRASTLPCRCVLCHLLNSGCRVWTGTVSFK